MQEKIIKIPVVPTLGRADLGNPDELNLTDPANPSSGEFQSAVDQRKESAGLFSFNFKLLLILVFLAFFSGFLLLEAIPLSSTEARLTNNVWQLLSGRLSKTDLARSGTEIIASFYLQAANLLTKSGVNFPQGSPSLVTFYYVHLFGLFLYLVTFWVGLLILQGGAKKIQLRSVIFAVFYFSSIGFFEKFIRLNVDSLTVFFALNYIYFCLRRSRRPSFPPFLLLDWLVIIFASFLSIRAFFLVLSLAFTRIALDFVESYNFSKKTASPLSLRPLLSGLALLGGVVLIQLLPIPVGHLNHFGGFFENLAAQWSELGFRFHAFRGYLSYLYEFLILDLGLPVLTAIFLLLLAGLYRRGGNFLSESFGFSSFVGEAEAPSPGLTFRLGVPALTYFLFVGSFSTVRLSLSLPLSLLVLLLLSLFLERVLLLLLAPATPTSRSEAGSSDSGKTIWALIVFFGLLMVFSLRLALVIDLKNSNFPTANGLALTTANFNRFFSERGVLSGNVDKNVAWVWGLGPGSDAYLERALSLKEYQLIRYLVFPNQSFEFLRQSVFVKKRAREISFRFPTHLSRYLERSESWARRVLVLNWKPEINFLIEPSYAVVVLN